MASIVNIEVDQGATKTVEFDWIDPSTQLPIDLTSYTAKMQVRSMPGNSVTCLDYTTGNGKIVLGGVAGTITILISATDSTVFPPTVPEWRRGVYDLFIIHPNTITTTMVARGEFTIIPRVTL